ncbi:hypothetical protein FF80_04088 [Devosia sp. LC5]|uniref:hypothetical protein n=1 Tax=Devosia sp. LC5 TaxID=1502724 RepID=UPI0004E3D54A|nr:hypothetical protein [Devosia sp. LC5]KFC61297.1 hypothetical protein FF80_04088 [Devosia sp. LC5]
MKLWAALANAFAGWIRIARGDADWRAHFAFTAPGLVTAILIYFFFAFLAVAFASMNIGMPGLPGIASALIVQGLSLAALALAIQGTKAALKSAQPMLDLMVPGTYVLVFYLLAGAILSLIGGPVLLLLWIALGYLLYRLARVATTWSLGISLAFAVLTVLLLVGMPVTLYMLSNPATPPI